MIGVVGTVLLCRVVSIGTTGVLRLAGILSLRFGSGVLDGLADADLVLDRVSLSLGCGVGFALGRPRCWLGAMLNRYPS